MKLSEIRNSPEYAFEQDSERFRRAFEMDRHYGWCARTLDLALEGGFPPPQWVIDAIKNVPAPTAGSGRKPKNRPPLLPSERKYIGEWIALNARHSSVYQAAREAAEWFYISPGLAENLCKRYGDLENPKIPRLGD